MKDDYWLCIWLTDALALISEDTLVIIGHFDY